MFSLPFRAVISDLDGTLLNANHMIGQFTIETLEKLAKHNIDIILATGRNYIDVSSILTKINTNHAVMITSNGARVHNLQGERLLANNVPEQIALEIMQLPFDQENVCFNTYQDDGWFINKDVPQLSKFHQDSGFQYQVVDFKKHHASGVEKLFFIGRTPQDLLAIEHQLENQFHDQITLTYSLPNCLEIMNKNVSKATALLEVLAKRDYGVEQCIAFGDGMNDLEVLSIVKKGCIMHNADQRLKSHLPQLEQIGSNQHEAVASYLRAIFAIN